MKKYIFKKSQLNEVLMNGKKRDLINESDFKTTVDSAQEGDYLYVDRRGKKNKSFYVSEVRDGTIFGIDTSNKARVHIPSTGLNDESGELSYVMVGTEKGERKKTEITVGNIDSVYLLRGKKPVEQVEIGTDDEDEKEQEDDRRKRSKITVKRKNELLERLASADEGDVIELTTGDLDEEEKIIDDTKTDIELKLTTKKEEGYIFEFKGSSGTDESTYNELGEYDELMIKSPSINVKEDDPNKIDITLIAKKDDKKEKFPITDIVIFHIKDEAPEDKKDDGDKKEGDTQKLTKQELEKLKKDPIFNQALRLDMEIDDILSKLNTKKSIKGKDRKKWKNGAYIRFEWVSNTIGESDYRIQEGNKFKGRYDLQNNRIKVTVPKNMNERGNRTLTIYFGDIETIKGDNNQDSYSVKVDVLHERGGFSNELLKNEKGRIYVHDYSA